MRLDANCSRRYTAVRNSGKRSLSAIELVVIHDPESPSAQSTAQYLANASANPGGSYHIIVGDESCYRLLDNDVIAWGAPNANHNGVHISIAGYARWKRDEWLKHKRALQRAAWKTAATCRMYHLPPYFREARALGFGLQGVTTHAEVSKFSLAHNLPGDHSHSDPGSGFPLHTFMAYVHDYYGRMR